MKKSKMKPITNERFVKKFNKTNLWRLTIRLVKEYNIEINERIKKWEWITDYRWKDMHFRKKLSTNKAQTNLRED